jgi:hypothetical protein
VPRQPGPTFTTGGEGNLLLLLSEADGGTGVGWRNRGQPFNERLPWTGSHSAAKSAQPQGYMDASQPPRHITQGPTIRAMDRSGPDAAGGTGRCCRPCGARNVNVIVGSHNLINLDAWQIKQLVQNTHDADVADSSIGR